MEQAIIDAGRAFLKSSFMDFPDYDENEPLDLTGAITALLWESLSDYPIDQIHDYLASVIKPQAPAAEPEKTYYLIGDEACRILMDEDIEALYDTLEDNETKCSLFVFISGETKHVDLVSAIRNAGNEEVSIITKAEYDRLSELM